MKTSYKKLFMGVLSFLTGTLIGAQDPNAQPSVLQTVAVPPVQATTTQAVPATAQAPAPQQTPQAIPGVAMQQPQVAPAPQPVATLPQVQQPVPQSANPMTPEATIKPGMGSMLTTPSAVVTQDIAIPKPAFVKSLVDQNIIPIPEEMALIGAWREMAPIREALSPHINAIFSIIHEAGVSKETVKAKLNEKLLELKTHIIHLLDVLITRREVVDTLINKINTMPKVRDFLVEKLGQMGITKEMLSNPQNIRTYLENLKNVANEAYAWLESKKGMQKQVMPATKATTVVAGPTRTTSYN